MASFGDLEMRKNLGIARLVLRLSLIVRVARPEKLTLKSHEINVSNASSPSLLLLTDLPVFFLTIIAKSLLLNTSPMETSGSVLNALTATSST